MSRPIRSRRLVSLISFKLLQLLSLMTSARRQIHQERSLRSDGAETLHAKGLRLVPDPRSGYSSGSSAADPNGVVLSQTRGGTERLRGRTVQVLPEGSV